jgi:AAA family ATP:ADP antiporter
VLRALLPWPQKTSLTLVRFPLATPLSRSTKDTLVVTALGGAEQIPYLTVYAVLPASVLFVLAFAALSSRMSRKALFNATLLAFLAFYALFTALLFPHRAALAPAALTARLLAAAPPGLAGAVAVIHNWPLSLFYVASELWGDVILSLLFWGLANEITAEREAMALYPLFGLGANVAQAAAGRLLKGLSALFAPAPGLSVDAAAVVAAAGWETQLRLLMLSVFAAGAACLALHAYIASVAPAWAAARAASEAEASHTPLPPTPSAASKTSKPRVRTVETLRILAGSPQMLCLAAMAVAQGLSSNIFQVAWKRQLRILNPDPSGYSAFMGDVATVSAIATGGAMLLAPALFRRLGWAGAAAATPWAMMLLGWAFFGSSIWASFGAAAGAPLPAVLLHALVLGGAAMYIFEKAAKFSLFKPAEEMVYLALDDASRTQGKAAVDVCATQVGKAGGSIFQQGLLVAFGGLGGALPALAICHTACVSAWIWAVASLAHHHGHLLGNLKPARRRKGVAGAAAAAAEAARERGYTDGPACDVADAPALKAAQHSVEATQQAAAAAQPEQAAPAGA